MASTAIRERRCTLRYRNLLVRQMVQMKNKISGLLNEAAKMGPRNSFQILKWDGSIDGRF